MLRLFPDAPVIAKAIGFGCSDLQPGLDKRLSKILLSRALDAGISYFDTSPRYGLSERFLGQFLPNDPSVITATKAGLDPLISNVAHLLVDQIKGRIKGLARKHRSKSSPSPSILVNPTEIYPKKSLEHSIHSSLKNLRRERLDVLLVHEPERLLNLEEVLDWIDSYIKAGLVRSTGLAVHRPGSNLLNYCSDNLIWQFPWSSKNFFNTQQQKPNIIFGAGQILYSAHPLCTVRSMIKTNPNSLYLVKTRDPSHIRWVRSL